MTGERPMHESAGAPVETWNPGLVATADGHELRVGIWLIGFLEARHYTGVDHHWIALDAFARYDVPLHDLVARSPRLVLDGSLDVARLQERFDVVLDCYVSLHAVEVQPALRFAPGDAGAARRCLFKPLIDSITAEIGQSRRKRARAGRSAVASSPSIPYRSKAARRHPPGGTVAVTIRAAASHIKGI